MELKQKIEELKKAQGAVILAHNYQLDEVQEVADYVGDSFYLSKIAASIANEVIVFCGVRFMAETAKILSPHKTVLLPESDAGCPLADTITAEDVRSLKKQHPNAPVVCYINSSAEVKAESDICCTSSNAVKLVAALPDQTVIFIPDENLGDYVAKQVPDKELILWKGCCVTHAKVQPDNIKAVRKKYPEAKILIHPECAPRVVAAADFAGSTAEIIRYAENSKEKTFVIGTELGVLHSLAKSCPDKKFFLLHPGLVCPNMKKTRLHSIYNALQQRQAEITVTEELAIKARLALTRMLG
ncbi:MAG: quinolinate synthase NadA [Pelosinus sp.]|nr:quinolinate synthase NadA [Pelosinus sp.]